MERLTKFVFGRYRLKPGCELDTLQGARAVVDRLAAYEDTGLEPEEIVQARGAMKSALGIACALQSYRNAEKDGRMVVLPPEFSFISIGDYLEPVKVKSALDCELRKLKYRTEHKPGAVSILDYTIIAALRKTLSEAEAALKGGDSNAQT